MYLERLFSFYEGINIGRVTDTWTLIEKGKGSISIKASLQL